MKNQREAGAFCDQILFSSEITTVFFIHYMDNGFTENLVTRENVSREKDRIRIGDRGTLSHSLLLYTLLIIERNVL